jgi:RHS repeat-associated protein
VTVDGGTLSGGAITAPAVTVVHGGVLSSPAPTPFQVYPLLVQVTGTVSVDATSRIDVSGEGRLSGGESAGGSYGGLGGLTGGGTTNPVYGDYADPDQPGGGAYDGSHAAFGGGLVRLTAGTLQLDGQLLADGGSSDGDGGSGGGVYVAVTTLTGAGSISAAGGQGRGGGGGGGGRIAVYAQDLSGFNAAAITAPGGAGGVPGGAGTVHVVQGAPHTHVRSYAPLGRNGNYVPVLDHVMVTFNNAIDTSAANLANFVIDGQMGRVQATGISLVGDRTYQFTFPALTESGPYYFTLLPSLLDAQGFPLDQDADGSPGDPEDFYSFALTVDTVPPRATQHSPAGDIAGTVDHVDVWFSKAIDTTTLTAAAVAITRPDGGAVAVASITAVGLNRFRISFAAQTLVGQYHVRVGPNVADLAGNLLDQNGNGIPGEPGDVYDASFNLVPVDLGLSNLTLGSDHLTAGQPVTVSWQGANRTGAALLGAWTDAVYLSTSDHWDSNAILLATVPHTGGLAQGQSYAGSATVLIPGALPGNHDILVRADVYNQEQEGPAAVNNVIAMPVPLDVTPLVPGGAAAAGTLTADHPADYYAIRVNGGDNLSLVLKGQADAAVNELYASFEAIPSRLSYDARSVKSDRDLTGRDQNLALVAPPGGGTYYVLVYGAQTADPPGYDLSASTGPFVITTITPDRGSNRPPDVAAFYDHQPVGRLVPETVTISGAGFDADTMVQFLTGDGTVHVPTATRLVSPQQLALDLDLTSWPAGAYDVRVVKGTASQVLPGAFTVVAGGVPHLETDLVTPAAMGFHVLTAQVIWVEYKNAGDAPMPAPILKLSADDQARLTADPAVAFPTPPFQDLPASVTDTVQVLATGSGATPGILQPGDSGRIPVYYLGRGYFPTHQMTFSLSDLTADDVTWVEVPPQIAVASGPGGGGSSSGSGTTEILHDWRIDWTQIAQGTLRPESVPADAWAAITANLASMVGSQWGDYDVALANDANFLHTIGQDTQDIGKLWNYQVAQASAALSPIRYLDGSVDASLATPGLPLTFSRVYGEPITSRYTLGSLGRGWSSNWDVSAQVESTGDVVLHGPGGVDRFFTLNPDGSYTASPGDHGQLTLTAGTYRLTETDQTVWQFRTDGLLDFVQDTNGNRITLGYTNGLLTTLTHSSGAQLVLAYNANGRLTSVTDPLGRVTTYEYDASGEHLIRVTQPGSRVTTYTYDTGTVLPREHALLSVTYPDGTHSSFTYDDNGRLTQTSGDNGGEAVSYAYDTAGGVTVTDATGRVTHLAFGLDGQLAQVRDGQGRLVNLGYGSQLQLSQLLGPAGEKYSYSFDTHGNLTGVRDPERQSTTFTYDPTFNQLTSFTDARGNGLVYTYDGHGNLTAIAYPDGTSEHYTYDSQGDVLTAKNRRGQTVTYTYNAAGQVTSKDYSTTSGVDFTYGYDAAGNLTSATDASGTTTMTYDPATGLLTRIDYPGGHYFTLQYDAAGRRTQRTDQDGNVENYAYDVLGRLDHMTDKAGALIVQYEYDASGRLSKKTLGNGDYTTYEYDAAGDVLHLVNFKPDGTVLSRYDYTYDPSGRVTSMATLDGTQTYGYDPLGQLTSVTYSNGRVVTYAYDAAGNRTTVTDNGVATAYTTNALNQYTAVGGTTYAYDADGNMTSKTENGVTTTYAYDAENRLVGVTTPADTWTYQYDAFGNRIGVTHNGVATSYVIDPTGLGNVAAEYNGGGQLIARYDDGYGLLDQTDTAGNAAYYTFSAVGNTSELTSTTGSVLNQYAYDPFGVSLGKTEEVANPFQYVGEYGVMDEGSGLESMRTRFYQGESGRFIQQDSFGIRGGFNLYAYANNAPTVWIDPLGAASSPVRTDPYADQRLVPDNETFLPLEEYQRIWQYNNDLEARRFSLFGGMGTPPRDSGEAVEEGIGTVLVQIDGLLALMQPDLPYRRGPSEPVLEPYPGTKPEPHWTTPDQGIVIAFPTRRFRMLIRILLSPKSPTPPIPMTSSVPPAKATPPTSRLTSPSPTRSISRTSPPPPPRRSRSSSPTCSTRTSTSTPSSCPTSPSPTSRSPSRPASTTTRPCSPSRRTATTSSSTSRPPSTAPAAR